MLVSYILSSVWVRLSIFSRLSIIQYVGLCVFRLPISLVMVEIIYIYILSYYHHQIGSMNYYPLFRVRSWNNGVRCMSVYILIHIDSKKLAYFGTKFETKCDSSSCRLQHSGETDEANCSWLHPVWPPPKRPDRDSTFCVESRASTELIFCIHRDFDVRNNVYKPRRLVCECCRDISAWKSRVMKPTVLRNPGRMKPTEYRDEANWFSNWTDGANCW